MSSGNKTHFTADSLDDFRRRKHNANYGNLLQTPPNIPIGGPTYYDFEKINRTTALAAEEVAEPDRVRAGSFFKDFSYVVPGEEEANVRKAYVDDEGLAMGVADQPGREVPSIAEPGAPIGKMQLTPESAYFKLLKQIQERDQLNQFKTFCFEYIINSGIDEPHQKAFWRKNFPELFKEMREGIRAFHKRRAKMEILLLEGPKGEKDMELLMEEYIKSPNFAQFAERLRVTPTVLPPGFASMINQQGTGRGGQERAF